ncbi:MAG: hypothetical protein CR993_07750 [Rhodobacterales bacterium]|nr:MAG: hypothetical protein CR993_07750 [Rhodobacterales bacterium]
MQLDWKIGGVALGFVFFLAVLLVKPIGVSTQFVIFDGIVADMVNPELVTQTEEGGYTSTNAYLAKSNGKYAKNIANPLNYSFVFVIAMMIGAGVSGFLRGGNEDNKVPAHWAANFGDSPAKRYAAAFIGGFIVLYGARLAGGCTSGHMMSGMMQTSISGYLFALGAFGAAVPVALMLFKKEG